MPHATDLNLTPSDIQGLTSAEALAAFLTKLGYDTSRRVRLTPEAIGLAGEAAAPLRSIEVLAEDAEGFLRVVFVQLRSLTARSRNDLARVLGRTNVDHLLILTADFDVLEFVLLQKRRRLTRGPAEAQRIEVVPLTVAVARKAVGSRQLRAMRRFTWTSRDGLEQFDKLCSVFEAAAFSEDYFCNRALFADHYLLTRLRDDAAWRDNPSPAFQQVKQLLADARLRWLHKGEAIVREELFEPIFKVLGFQTQVNKAPGESHTRPDYLLTGPRGKTAAFVYAWDRWLDGPDFNPDQQTPEENPGACVVTALDEGSVDWIIVTNGRLWRLYSRHAHSRATNFYEVDLVEALTAAGETDPNEAFRYWWLFFRAAAFAPVGVPALAGDVRDRSQTEGGTTCWLDVIAKESRDYAKELGNRLKQRVFETIFSLLAQGFLEDRLRRLGVKRQPTEEELHDTFDATLTFLYRILFLLYAESRDLLPIREAPYREASLTRMKEEIAERAGVAETEVAARLEKAYTAKEATFYDRLLRLCAAMDRGDPALNVPVYNGGLFAQPSTPAGEEVDNPSREQRIARYLAEHKVPDRYLALAIDRLSRDPDDKTLALVFIDYKSLEVRHLGSIYEGLLEFKLRVAAEDLTTQTEKGKEKFLSLKVAKTLRGKTANVVVRMGEVYLSNDKAERKASGSYYTPDPIVEYIVSSTVGPVLAEKLELFRDELRSVRKTFDRELAKLKVPPIPESIRGGVQTPRDFAATKTYEAHRELVDRLFAFHTLDPAMGSGHFLVETVDFITDRLLTFLNQFPVNPVSFMLDLTRSNILAALGEQGVSVDPDKLTEVNLLKRHVLKRCIYGVDLNPMAVELAKISLWLDAFTIGAPLSFLDHHLRCGNSLIGATFAELEAASKGQLFSIDYEPLVDAIRHVIHVNEMPDSTAEEVQKSAIEYAAAREELSGYRIIFDVLLAKHFGFKTAVGLLEFGADLDLKSRDGFLASLRRAVPTKKGEKPAADVVAEIEQFAQGLFHNFFHWDLEFPEVFFEAPSDGEKSAKHKDKIRAGSAGFDSIVGNPPYLSYSGRQGEKLEHRSYFDSVYGADRWPSLHGLFIKRALMLGQDSASFIVPDQVGHLEGYQDTRASIMQQANLVEVRYWGEDVFDDAVTPSLTFIARKAESKTTVIRALDGTSRQAELEGPAKWTPPSEYAAILEKISRESTSLGDCVGDPGVHTGNCSEQLIVQLESSADVVPILEGKQVSRYCCAKPAVGLRTGYQKSGDDYFTIRPLTTYRAARFVIRQTAAYPIVGPRLHADYFRNSLLALFDPETEVDVRYLVALLNSRLLRFAYQQTVQESAQKAFPQVKVRTLRSLPIRLPGTNPIRRNRHDELVELVNEMLRLKERGSELTESKTTRISELDERIDRTVYAIYELSEIEAQKVEAWFMNTL